MPYCGSKNYKHCYHGPEKRTIEVSSYMDYGDEPFKVWSARLDDGITHSAKTMEKAIFGIVLSSIKDLQGGVDIYLVDDVQHTLYNPQEW